MAGNPRIDELRKKVEKDPGSRLFAQLAEELRKEGDLEEAIRVARDGLQKHPSYPSARMTLGRSLLDTRNYRAARSEFEHVLKGAPDNILASRFLAECLQQLGDVAAAIARYRATLVLAPGDKQILARIETLEGATGAAPTSVRPPVPHPFPRRESPKESPAEPPGFLPPAPRSALAPEARPIPVVAADEEFELERPYEAPTWSGAVSPAWPAPTSSGAPSPAGPVVAPSAPPVVPAEEGELELEEQEFEAGTGTLPFGELPAPTFRSDLLAAAAREVAAAAEEPAGPVASATLAEIYFNQGLVEKAMAVYRELMQRDPNNPRLVERLQELERAGGAPDRPAARRPQVERTIARLEGFLAAVKRG